MFARGVQILIRLLAWVGPISVICAGGCTHLRLPAIDPTGRRILLPQPNFTTLNSHRDPVSGAHRHPLLDHLLHRNEGAAGAHRGLLGHHARGSQPAFASPPPIPDCQLPAQLPNTANTTLDAIGPTPEPQAVAPRVLVPGPCQDPYTASQTSQRPCHGPLGSEPGAKVTLTPQRQLAPVGTEVVLLGGVCDEDGYFRMREPLEWALSQGSVGHFVEPGMAVVSRVGFRGVLGEMLGEPLPNLLSNNYATTCTSKKPQVLTRGTVKTDDDVIVQEGQGWIGVTSPVEGDTYVTLMAPDLDGWQQRTQTAVIHWVDGQWVFPPSRITQSNQPQTLTTTITRRITPTPLPGWIVRYEILDPTATFDDGTTLRDITTDSQGQASVQIQPATPQGGSARVRVQVIRPIGETPNDRLVVGEGATSITWATSQLTLRLDGPETADLQGRADYRLEVSNPGTLAASDVSARLLIPAGFELTSATPTPQLLGGRLEWSLGNLGPQESRTIEMAFRVAQGGNGRVCASVQSAGSSPVEECVTTQVIGDALFLEMLGPNPDLPLRVGEMADYQVRVVNRGDRRLTGIVLTDRFDAGLQHASGTESIDMSIDSLEPGQTRELSLSFRVAAPGRHCHTLEAVAPGARPARTQACVTAEADERPPADDEEPRPSRPDIDEGSDSGADARDARVEVQKRGPLQMTEGEQGEFYILIENKGETTLRNIQVIDEYPPELRPSRPDPRANRLAEDRVVWYLTELAPNERRTFQVTVEALFDVQATTMRATVRGADGWQVTDDLSVSIAPPASGRRSTPRDLPRGATPLPGMSGADDAPSAPPRNEQDRNVGGVSSDELELTIDDRGERWNIGDTIEYWVAIRNPRSVPDSNVELTIQLPPQVTLQSYKGPVSAESHSDDWRILEMPPIRTIRPGETIEFRVYVKVMSPGELVTRAQVKSLRSPAGISRQDTSLGIQAG